LYSLIRHQKFNKMSKHSLHHSAKYSVEELPVIKIDYHHFNNLVHESFPHVTYDYCFLSEEQPQNGTTCSYRITKPYSIDSYYHAAHSIDPTDHRHLAHEWEKFVDWENGASKLKFETPSIYIILEKMIQKNVFKTKSGTVVSEALFLIEASW